MFGNYYFKEKLYIWQNHPKIKNNSTVLIKVDGK